MAHAPDRSLRQQVVELLAVDSFPRTGALLGADGRLLDCAAREILDRLAEEAALDGTAVTGALVAHGAASVLAWG